MVIGDKVRMLHGQGEGIVVRIDGDAIRVMLNEGIEIPVPRKQLVLVRPMQKDLPAEKAAPKTDAQMERGKPGMLFLKQGLYLAGIPAGSGLLEYHLINQSDFEIFVLVYRLARPVNQFHGASQIFPKSAVAIKGNFPRQENNHMTGLAFQFMKYHPDHGEPVPAEEFRFRFSHIPGSGQNQRIPVLEKEGFLLQLDGDSVHPDATKIKESMLSSRQPEQRPAVPSRQKDREIDLHIEQLRHDSSALNPAEILEIQLKHFEQALDRALLENLNQLIVIHGVGNGVLRSEIHRRLSKNTHIAYFKDARREKFGYGATEIGF
jgi:hypothetical protein